MRLGLMDSRPWKRALLVFVLSGILGSCSPDDLLDVAYPDYITEQAIESASGAEALRVAAIGGFARFLNQGPAAVVNDALWSDQLVSARIFLDFLDHRTAYPTADDIGYIDWSEAHNQALRAVKAMTEYLPDGPDKDTKIGHMYVLDGVGMTILAELYCNGIPFGEVVDGQMVFEETPLTYNQVFERAIERLDAALAIRRLLEPR